MRTAFLAIGLAGLLGGTAVAQTVPLSPAAVVATRQAGFKLLGGSMNEMKRAVETSSDVKSFKQSAEGIVAWGRVLPGLFPVGTEANSKAKPAVWSDVAGFEKASAALVAAAEGLEKAAASGDSAAFAAALKATGETCGGCHRPFRQR
ncbi:putative Cytochrome c' [Rhodovastum atsumiense]|uniref:c-type cytochrome n=1 Tax=Rhodovastum atsumiense TaxID=504468 RepID=UPI00139F2BD9|nr:cytochrome c [Rhodovastum atsumiense]CAH2604234.1 putative Cytochrome c' [Rhodovastum atsumiense]